MQRRFIEQRLKEHICVTSTHKDELHVACYPDKCKNHKTQHFQSTWIRFWGLETKPFSVCFSPQWILQKWHILNPLTPLHCSLILFPPEGPLLWLHLREAIYLQHPTLLFKLLTIRLDPRVAKGRWVPMIYSQWKSPGIRGDKFLPFDCLFSFLSLSAAKLVHICSAAYSVSPSEGFRHFIFDSVRIQMIPLNRLTISSQNKVGDILR